MKKLVLNSVVLWAAAVVLSLPVFAGEIEPNFAAYLGTISDDDFASAIVYLTDRPNIRALDNALRAERAPLGVRHERVIHALQQAADRSQPTLLGYLNSKAQAGVVKGYTPYWLMNLVVVSATKTELYGIAQRPEVEAVESNFRAVLIDPVDVRAGSPTLGIGVTNSLRAINADRVWHELGYTGAGRLIGGMDTGVDGDHAALTDRWRGNWHPWQECWRDALGGGTTYPVDNHGHGTHTMGTMCGAGHATGDTVGVAWEAQWIADNSINQSVGPEFDNDVLGAFQWFADPDGDPGTTDDVPDVVQNSWGIDGRFGYDYEDCDYRWQTAIEACEAAGVVVTFSAGNEGPSAQTHRSPANICNTSTVNFSVGAVDAENYGWPYPIASYSSRGPSDCDGVTIKPEVVAPGSYVYSSYNNGGYVRMSGTSMAGPHVAGVVALMRQANPNADVQIIKQVLMNTARDEGTAGEDNTYGWGCIDAYEAVLAVMVTDTIPPEVTVTAPNGGEIWTVGQVHTITWDATDNVGVSRTDIFYSYDGGSNYDLIDNLSGNPGTYDWTVPNTPSTTCLVKVEAYDAASNVGSDVSDGYFTIEEAPAPYVWVKSIDLSLVTKGKTTNAVAEVLIWDQANNPVFRASVSSHWDGLTTDSDVFMTKKTGVGTCNSDKLKDPVGWWYFSVDDVVVAGYTFRSDLGETSDAIYAGGAKAVGPVPGGFSLAQNHPNPFNPETDISYGIPTECMVHVAVYNLLGQNVATLVSERQSAGIYTVTWNAAHVPTGVYFYRITAGEFTATNKMILMK
ncbi:MAG: S8 family serine peptidase [Gemmatimonadota bacterium]|nr:MAG: S8 family serine peptidase [Gemmatimonadota bacterium]